MAKLIDIVKNGGYIDAAVGIIDEVTKSVPEMAFFDARLIDGTQFQSLVKTGLPTTGFRALNNGVDASRSAHSLRTFNLGVLAGLCQVDKAEAQASCAPGVNTIESFLGDQATDLVVSGAMSLASKVWYGAKAGAEGFDGVSALVSDDLTIDAGGTTANKQASVYAVGNSATKACGLVFAKNSGFFLTEDLVWKDGKMLGENGKEVPAYWADLTGWAGFSAVNAKKMARLANLGDSKNLTDALLAKVVNAYRKANNGLNPDALFTTFDQLAALQTSRSVVAPSVGKVRTEITAAWPTDYEGIPLIASNALLDTEAVWTAESSSSSSSSASA